MPRLTPRTEDAQDNHIRATIDYVMSYKNISLSDMAKYFGICERTLYTRRKKPESLTLGELRKLSKMSNIPLEQLLATDTNMIDKKTR